MRGLPGSEVVGRPVLVDAVRAVCSCTRPGDDERRGRRGDALVVDSPVELDELRRAGEPIGEVHPIGV